VTQVKLYASFARTLQEHTKNVLYDWALGNDSISTYLPLILLLIAIFATSHLSHSLIMDAANP
jgi:hypothetical protein